MTEVTLLSNPHTGTILRASSVLQKDIKLYGPMNALDLNNGSTSWNSEGGNDLDDETHTLTIHFGRSVYPTCMKLQFQAGFSAELVTVYNPETNRKIAELDFDDIHEIQSHNVSISDEGSDSEVSIHDLKLVLQNCTDFYGRIILYQLEVWGYER